MVFLYGKDFKSIAEYIHRIDQKILQAPSEHNSSFSSIASIAHTLSSFSQEGSKSKSMHDSDKKSNKTSRTIKRPTDTHKKKRTSRHYSQMTIKGLQIKMVIAGENKKAVFMTQDGQIVREKEHYHGCTVEKISLWKVLFVCGQRRVEIPVGMEHD